MAHRFVDNGQQHEPRGKGFILKGFWANETQVPNNYMTLFGPCVSLVRVNVF